MGYFDGCRPDQRFTCAGKACRKGSVWVVNDWDQRRTVAVSTTWDERDEDFIFEALAKHIDTLPEHVSRIGVSQTGELEETWSDISEDRTLIPYYPLRSLLPAGIRTIQRHNLIEVERLALQLDLACYPLRGGGEKTVAFKYYMTHSQIASFWHEANCLARMPRHPNIVPLDSFIIDTIDGEDLVVGLATDFAAESSLAKLPGDVFKFKYLQQLIEVIDYLNLTVGIVHGDVCPWNLLIDPETDNLRIFDFGRSSRLGWQSIDPGSHNYNPARSDVKLAAFTVYEVITRDIHFREERLVNRLDAGAVLSLPTWTHDANVKLDQPVEEYRRLLSDWVLSRMRTDMWLTHYTQAPQFMDWPPLPKFPLIPFMGVPLRRSVQMRNEMARRGSDIIWWQRPASSRLPLPFGMRLLATGDVLRPPVEEDWYED